MHPNEGPKRAPDVHSNGGPLRANHLGPSWGQPSWAPFKGVIRLPSIPAAPSSGNLHHYGLGTSIVNVIFVPPPLFQVAQESLRRPTR